MKNRLKNIALGLSLSLVISSCSEFSLGGSFLDQTPESTGVDTDKVFSKKEYAEQVLTTAYTQLHYPINWAQLGYDRMIDRTDALTDIAHSANTYAGANSYYTGAYSSSTVNKNTVYYFLNSKTWTGIRYSWLVIENIDRVPDMTSEAKERAKAEAKVLIATHYADMFRNFGGVPILRKSISTADEFVFPRASAQETLDFIVGLIDDAIPYLEWRVANPNDDGRMTAAYAMALKQRVLVFAASPLFNSNEPYFSGADDKTWFGSEDPARWATAVAAGAEFFAANSGNEYALNQAATQDEVGYRKAFRDAYFTRANPEMILSLRRGYNNSYGASFCGGADNFAKSQSPTIKYFQMFPMKDGSDFNFNWSNPQGKNPFADRDPRFYETILSANDNYGGRQSELWVGGRDRTEPDTSTGLRMYKFSQDYTATTSVGHVDCYPAMRLADVMLNYAEALNETDNRALAAEYVYKVRNRVGLTIPSQTALSGYNKVQMRDFILDERAREFGFEDSRWFDIVRWKKADCLTTPMKGLNMRRSGNAVVPDATYSYEIYTAPQSTRTAWWGGSWSSRWYLSAFPANEVNKGYGLTQNPGW